MNDNNVFDINGNKMAGPDAPKPVARTFLIQTTFSDVPVEATGFLGVTPSFIAVALGDGNLEMVVPLENLVFARAKDPA